MRKRLMLTKLKVDNCCFYTTIVFKIEICIIFLKRHLYENEFLHTRTFYIKMNHFDIVFHIT